MDALGGVRENDSVLLGFIGCYGAKLLNGLSIANDKTSLSVYMTECDSEEQYYGNEESSKEGSREKSCR